MKTKLLSIILALLAIVSCFGGCTPSENKAENTDVTQNDEYQIKNVIMLIPDGGGYALYDLANDVKTEGGFLNDSYKFRTPTDKKDMTMRSHLAGSMITLNYQGALTDSAAAGTALATGYKTLNGRIGINHEGKPIANVLEAAQSKGKSTGLVATYEWMHATPASYSAHVMQRDDYKNLYEQIENQGIDVVLGSGYGAVSSYATIQNAVDRGYTIIKNKYDLEKVKPGDRIWGDATNNSSPYDINLKEGEPTLAEMTKAAITALSGNEKGFFLMVEGSKVDTGGHANDAVVTTSEYLAFDAAFKVAVDFAKGRNDTVVIAAPDHDTGDMQYDKISNLLPVVTATQLGRNSDKISWGTTSHSTLNVGVWMYVPEGVNVIEGLNPTLGDTPETRTEFVVDNTAIAPYIASLFGTDLDELTKELFVDVTDIGLYSSAVGKFTFNNGNKYVYKNASEYFENGKKKSLDGMVTLYADGRFYVPSVMVTEEDFKHVNVEGAGKIFGSGTKTDPYIIDEEWKFVEFTGALINGETYEGKYFKQTKDLDLKGNKDYPGIGSGSTFAGVYDGDGHTINVSLIVDRDESVFPYVTGTVMNLGTTGKIRSFGSSDVSRPAGIVRSVRDTGRLINCYSTMELEGSDVKGLASSNYGLIENCYFGGTITARDGGAAIAGMSGGVFRGCYYKKDCGKSQANCTSVTADETENLVNLLNEGRISTAQNTGITEASLKYWRMSDDGKIEIYSPIPTVSKVTITNDVTQIDKGDGIQLSAVVEGEYNPSQSIVWSVEGLTPESKTAIYDDGYLLVAKDEPAQKFTVVAKSAYDGSVTDIASITVGEKVLTEPDGSRARPYEVTCANDFYEITKAVLGGKNLNGIYFVQTADIDMSEIAEYNGIPSSLTFAGVYDGRGYTIKVDYESETDNSPFGTTSGTIMNVSTTGKIKGVTRPAGIVRKITHGGIIINCFSDVEVTGVDEAAGIVRSVYGKAANCFFNGAVSAKAIYPCTYIQPEGYGIHNYSVGAEHYVSGDETIVVKDELSADGLVKQLNEDRAESAKQTGIALNLLCDWEYDEKRGAVLVRK